VFAGSSPPLELSHTNVLPDAEVDDRQNDPPLVARCVAICAVPPW
jgi:hypothetical protein